MFPRLKRSLLTAADELGISSHIARSRWRRDRLLILCYHGVSLEDEHEWNPELFIQADTLERRLERLRTDGCTVLPVGEAIERLYSRDLPERAVTLTFDDGYFDFMVRAYPLLASYGFPATVYLATGRCVHNLPITRLLVSYALWKKRASTLDTRGIPNLDGSAQSLAKSSDRARITTLLHSHTTDLPKPEELDRIARMVLERLGVDYDALVASRIFTLMNPAEVQQMSARGVDFQLHTHWHRTPEDSQQFREEVRTNGDRIESMTGVRPTHFCYPSGVYRSSYLGLLRDEGVVSATTCEHGLAAATTNPLLMPRFIDTNATTEGEFGGWLTGAAEWLPQRVRPSSRAADAVGRGASPSLGR